MAKTTTTKTSNQPKTVSLATYLQSLAIAILVTGVAGFIAAYFFTINMHGDMRAAVIDDIKAASKVER